ncbi:hypothetical protein LTR08_007949 [Meristemomyces frigidus]|nr:hypothetical protein LTR08_007949 [Meristemomyces frigidus]
MVVAVRSGLGRPSSALTQGDISKIRKALLVAQLFFYLCATFASDAVVEFLMQVKGKVRVVLLDGLRIITYIWGLAGIAVMTACLAISASKVKAPAFIVLGIVGGLIALGTFIAAAMVTVPLQMKRSTRIQVILGFSPAFV